MERAHIFMEVGVGDDAAELVLPTVAMAIDDSGEHDHAPHLDDDCLPVAGRRAEIGSDCRDSLALDENVALVEIPDCGVDGDHRRASEENPSLWACRVEAMLDRGPFGRILLVVGSRSCCCRHLTPLAFANWSCSWPKIGSIAVLLEPRLC